MALIQNYYSRGIHCKWEKIIKGEVDQQYFTELDRFLSEEYTNYGHQINPPRNLVFCPFEITNFEEIKVVIVGQDPYPECGLGDGFGFSLKPYERVSDSVKVIYSALAEDVGFVRPNHGCLKPWAKQGVILLDATLTYRKNDEYDEENYENEHRNLHFGKGWETFIGHILNELSTNRPNLVFLLWGKYANRLRSNIRNSHLILPAFHPNSSNKTNTLWNYDGCFSKTNEYLRSHGRGEINWQLPISPEDLIDME